MAKERRDETGGTEPPLLSAHPWRLPILLLVAFAATVAIAAAVLRGQPHTAGTQVARSRKG